MKTVLLTPLLIAIVTGTACAHPVHTQVTEVEWNPDTRCFEVAMKLDAVALEDSVSIRQGSRFRLESAKQVDEVLAQWLPKYFRIDIGGSSQPGSIRWAGHELELHVAWLYFEYTPPTPVGKPKRPTNRTVSDRKPLMKVGDIRITNQCLFDVRPETTHFVILRRGQTVHQKHCGPESPWADFDASSDSWAARHTSRRHDVGKR